MGMPPQQGMAMNGVQAPQGISQPGGMGMPPQGMQQPGQQAMGGGPHMIQPGAQPLVAVQSPPQVKTRGFNDDPQPVVCQWCGEQVTTVVEHSANLGTHLAAFGICMFGFWCGCCLAPYFMDATKMATHTCPKCKNMIAKKGFLTDM
jgi:lipopolysaccharide-induced tumor necrosis factor-alpha factor